MTRDTSRTVAYFGLVMSSPLSSASPDPESPAIPNRSQQLIEPSPPEKTPQAEPSHIATVARGRATTNTLNEKVLSSNHSFCANYEVLKQRSCDPDAPNLRSSMVLLHQLPWLTGALVSSGPLADWFQRTQSEVQTDRHKQRQVHFFLCSVIAFTYAAAQ